MSLLLPKHIYIDEPKYRKWLSTLECVITGHPDVQCAHIRKRGNAGMGKKSSDSRCLPMYWILHTEQHNIGNEVTFWEAYGGIEKAIELAENLYKVRYDLEQSMELIRKWRAIWM